MNSINKQLSQEEIVNPMLIQQIQQQINLQFPHYTSKQKAFKLATMIHNKIDQSLPNYSNTTKKNVRNALLVTKLSPNSFTINSKDIIDTSIHIARNEELETSLPRWIQSKFNIEPTSIENYVNNLIEERTKIENEMTRGGKDEFLIPQQNLKRDSKQNVRSVLSYSEIAATSYTDVAENRSLGFGDLHTNVFPEKPFRGKKKNMLVAIVAFLIMIILATIVDRAFETSNEINNVEIIEANAVTYIRPANELPSYLQYEPINESALRTWLDGRNSILADEPYFSTIVTVANRHNLHPFLLFAITGQEQGFVPRTHENATEIANNPFNVFHSWQDFNTNILESSQIAAKTIINLSEERPENADPFQWINRKYAEDPNWWKGVSSIFTTLEDEVQ
ncbi:hypothetical protein [Calidifontibacillus oryziterrae]|uniref:hypothetical protein n=1 Tax=Calidifontibacillus oryziterrae TaxID=1191699 RepID=UPI0003160BFF|nr:hypothetical protein [Calidifontibacillus oryziterrae]